jgi:dolichol-phosphate mannosyltransferase
VIPAWNEEGTIRQTVRDADAALSAVAAEHEIIVVDDGSGDGTAEHAHALAAAHPRIRLVQLTAHRGYGAALRAGLQVAALDFVAWAGAGHRFEPGELRHLLGLVGQYDVASTCPAAGGRLAGRLLSWGYDALARVLAGGQGHAPGAGITITRRELLPLLEPESDNGFARAEVLARARMGGLTTAQLHIARGPATGRQGRGTLLALPGILAALLQFWWSRRLFAAPAVTAGRTGRWFWFGLMFLAVLAGSLLLGNLSYPLLEPDEGRYAEVAREMVATGDWVVPRLHQKPFYDKPLLFYWLVGTSYRLFGVHEWAARLVPAVASWLTVLACYVLGRRLVGALPAFLSALALTVTIGFVQCGRVVILDSLLTLFVTLSLLTAHEAVSGPRLCRPWWVASAVCCALGVLTKGPVALVLLVPPVAAHAWLNRSPAGPRLRQWAGYVGLVFLLVAPSYVAITVRDPRFAYHFFIDQHLVRFFLREYHVQPAWYYVPVLLVGCLPWSFLLVPLGRWLLTASPEARAARPASLGFLVLWCVWCVAFFSASSSKLPPYVLPAMPAIAILVGSCLAHLLFASPAAGPLAGARTTVPRTAGIVLAAGWAVVSIGAWRMGLMGTAPALCQAGVCAVVLAGLAGWGARLSGRAAWLLCGGLACLLTVGVAHQVIPAWASRRSPMMRYPEICHLARQGQTPVACYEGEWGSVPFYLGRTDGVISLSGLSGDEVLRFLVRQPQLLLVVRHKADLQRFGRELKPFVQVTRALQADEIGVGILEAAPWWKRFLDQAAPATNPWAVSQAR